MSVEEIGSRVTMALEQDGGSWVLYNLAALYWRVIGNVGQAIECLRHAIAYAEMEAGMLRKGKPSIEFEAGGDVFPCK